MAQSLCFNDFTFSPVIHDNQPWIPARQLANALGYKDERSVHKIYERNKDEFSSMMSTVVNLTTGVMELPTRIFSLRGCYALAMFARTPIAKAFRKWCLDVIERYGDRVPVERPISLTPSTPDDRKPLRDMVNVWARLSGVHPSNLWPQVRARFQLGRIDDLPANWLPDALAWVQSKIDELNQKPKAALPAAEPLFDEAPLLELAEDIRRAQQTYRSMYADMIPRVFRLAFPIISAVERRLTNKKYPPFSELRPYSQMDNYLTELRSLSSLAERLPDQHNPAMCLLEYARILNASRG